MANDYYTHGSTPATGSPGSSSVMRSEFDLVMAGFAKLPSLTGNGNRAVIVNSGGTALALTTGTMALGGAFSTLGAVTIGAAFITSGGHSLTLTTTGTTNVTLPTTGTVATRAGTETFTNKTITAPVLSGTVTGTYTLGGTPTISAPILSGTVTGTYTLDGAITIDAPILSGVATGTYELGGTPTITGAALQGTTTVPGTLNVSGGTGITFLGSGGGGILTNTLLAYEEGTWTPSLGGTATYTTRTGRYIKIGKYVFIYGFIQVSTIGSGSTSTVSGLPFTTANTTFGTIGVSESSSLAVSLVSVSAQLVIFGTSFTMRGRTAAAVSDGNQGVFGNGTRVAFSGWYEATS